MIRTHLDQLAEWWENAEPGIPRAGDTVIFDERHRSLGFHVTQASKDHPRGYDDARILHRAPKPKPAWHDAVAVIASTDYCERQVWERESDGTYSGSAGDVADDYELRDVTPLIEAKATREQAVAAVNLYYLCGPGGAGWPETTVDRMRDAIDAALAAGLTAGGADAGAA